MSNISSFQSPTLILPIVDGCVVFSGTGMVGAMLEPFMKNEVKASQTQVGLAFLATGLSYITTSLIAGQVSL